MQGQRIYPETLQGFEFHPGEYWINPETNTWYACTPNGHLADLRLHGITPHDDGTITVYPSIAIWSTDGDGKEVQVYHGYIENGVWRDV